MKEKADIGLVGLAVMGTNLILNMESKGFTVACFNRTVSKVDDFINSSGQNKNIIGCHSMEELVSNLKRPRRIMLMVKAGNPVDEFIDKITPYLKEEDIIIDGGNSHFRDTIRRTNSLAEKNILFIGAGVSGGEEGALKGPSIMPGGNSVAWKSVKSIFQSIAAKVEDNQPCCEWIGSDGSGHFVKMVHNGIEYGDMQLICEAYQLMSKGLSMSAYEIHEVFADWNNGVLNSYLIEITGDILKKTDEETKKPIVDLILDTAGQKGTGKWMSQTGLDLGVGIPQIAESVFARCLSAIKDERVQASKQLAWSNYEFTGDKTDFISKLQEAVYASKICSYAQGYQMLRVASKLYKWDLNFGDIALMWRGGCIIRAQFLGKIKEAFDNNHELANLLLDSYFKKVVIDAQNSWRSVVKTAIDMGVPIPAMETALIYYDSYRCDRLPANLLQAQRDYFGAHTYERIDKPRGKFFHTDWTGTGGKTSASTYVV